MGLLRCEFHKAARFQSPEFDVRYRDGEEIGERLAHIRVLEPEVQRGMSGLECRRGGPRVDPAVAGVNIEGRGPGFKACGPARRRGAQRRAAERSRAFALPTRGLRSATGVLIL